MISIDTFSSLVDAIYDAGLHPEKWQHALTQLTLTQLTASIGANVADFKLTDLSRARFTVIFIGLHPEVVDRSIGYYGNMDPIVPETERKPLGALNVRSRGCPQDRPRS